MHILKEQMNLLFAPGNVALTHSLFACREYRLYQQIRYSQTQATIKYSTLCKVSPYSLVSPWNAYIESLKISSLPCRYQLCVLPEIQCMLCTC